MKRLTAFCRAVLLTSPLGLSLAACGESPAPSSAGASSEAARRAAPVLTAVGSGSATFREAFERGNGRVRVVALVSPT